MFVLEELLEDAQELGDSPAARLLAWIKKYDDAGLCDASDSLLCSVSIAYDAFKKLEEMELVFVIDDGRIVPQGAERIIDRYGHLRWRITSRGSAVLLV